MPMVPEESTDEVFIWKLICVAKDVGMRVGCPLRALVYLGLALVQTVFKTL